MKILILIIILILFVGCSKDTPTSANSQTNLNSNQSTANTETAERQKIFQSFQEYANNYYPGWKVIAIRKDLVESNDELEEKSYYYLNLNKDNKNKFILVVVADFEKDDGTTETKIFSPATEMIKKTVKNNLIKKSKEQGVEELQDAAAQADYESREPMDPR